MKSDFVQAVQLSKVIDKYNYREQTEMNYRKSVYYSVNQKFTCLKKQQKANKNKVPKKID